MRIVVGAVYFDDFLIFLFAVSSKTPASGVPELCRDRTFPTKHLTHLPHEYRVGDHVTLVVDYARVEELPGCRRMMLEAADRG